MAWDLQILGGGDGLGALRNCIFILLELKRLCIGAWLGDSSAAGHLPSMLETLGSISSMGNKTISKDIKAWCSGGGKERWTQRTQLERDGPGDIMQKVM